MTVKAELNYCNQIILCSAAGNWTTSTTSTPANFSRQSTTEVKFATSAYHIINIKHAQFVHPQKKRPITIIRILVNNTPLISSWLVTSQQHFRTSFWWSTSYIRSSGDISSAKDNLKLSLQNAKGIRGNAECCFYANKTFCSKITVYKLIQKFKTEQPRAFIQSLTFLLPC